MSEIVPFPFPKRSGHIAADRLATVVADEAQLQLSELEHLKTCPACRWHFAECVHGTSPSAELKGVSEFGRAHVRFDDLAPPVSDLDVRLTHEQLEHLLTCRICCDRFEELIRRSVVERLPFDFR